MGYFLGLPLLLGPPSSGGSEGFETGRGLGGYEPSGLTFGGLPLFLFIPDSPYLSLSFLSDEFSSLGLPRPLPPILFFFILLPFLRPLLPG